MRRVRRVRLCRCGSLPWYQHGGMGISASRRTEPRPIHAAIFPILIIVFVATLIRSAFGFGEALIAVPLLAFYMPVKVATPLAVLVSITIAAVVVAQDWRHIHLRSTGWLLLSTLFGIPLGLLLLVH